jgi:hypothetical protein
VNFPRPFPGANYFFLSDGKFFDVQIDPNRMIVIETNQHLSVAETGRRLTAQEKVGGCLAINFPVIYTSSPTPAEEADAIQKFRVEQDSIVLETSRPILGQILDLEVSDLNQDGVSELLVTVRNPNGIFTQVLDVF